MKDHLWTGISLITPLKARVIGRAPSGVDGVSIDTRTLEQGDLFFAIKGHNSDGHAFIAKAFAMGAAACVVDEAHVDYIDADGPLYVVRDTLKAMEGLGQAARARSNAWIAAITGSVGKTSTKEMLRLTLESFGATHASAASYNNHWGVPLTLARMPQDAEFGVFEIGMNHAGEITPLVGMVRPQVAVVTAIAPVHLENLGSLEAIADAKAEIFSGLAPDGVAVINRDAPFFDRLLEAARAANARRILTFGEHPQADARLIHARRRDQSNMVDADVMGRRLDYRIAAPGKHVALNSLAVLLVADAMGVAPDEAAQTFAQFSAPAGRGAQTRLRIAGGEVLLIDEAYNANPVSMRAALDVLAASPVGAGGRRIAVLGDMLELGPDEARLHRELADVTMACGVDLVFAAGPLMKHMFDALAPSRRGLWAPTSAALQAEVPAAVRPGDAVMVKGSNGSKMSAVVAALRTLAASQKSETSSC
jgi:UDP-N-acetylmuramoyl-tripeptide--D-alanyl-D-alanine ligase